MASYHRVTGSLQVQRGQWVVRARVYDPKTGRKPQRAKVTGLKAPGNKRAAQQIMKEIVAQWEKEANTGIAIGDPLFSEYVQKWLENKKDVRANTLKSYHDYARVHILPALGDLKVREMTVQQLQWFTDQLLEKVSVSSARKIHVVVSGAFMLAVRDGFATANIAEYVVFPKAEKYEGTAYRPEHLLKLLQVAEAEGEPIRSAIILGACYGLRRSEIVGLRWSDIDFENGVVTIKNTVTQNGKLRIEMEDTKTSKSRRTISLLASTVPYLMQLKEEQERAGVTVDKVCAWPDGRPVRPDYIYSKLQKLTKQNDLPNIRVHDLRHTAASLLAKEATPKQVQEFLGHENVSTTLNTYTHLLDEDRKATSNIMDGVLEKFVFCSSKCSSTCGEMTAPNDGLG